MDIFLRRHTHKPTTSHTTQPTSPPLLPPELIECIIDELGFSNDTQTLKSCSLVSTSFVFRSQSHLFKSIDLDCDLASRFPRKQAYERVYKLLVKNPHLGVYVRHLRLGDDSEEDYHAGGISSGHGHGRASSWILNSKTLPHFLSLLPRLHSFALTFNSEWTNWMLLPANTRYALEMLFTESTTLKSVSLEFLTDVPASLFLGPRNLFLRIEHLGLSCVEVAPPEVTQDPQSSNLNTKFDPPTPIIKSLFLRGTPASTIDILSKGLSKSNPSKKFSTLQKLSLTPTFENGFAGAVAGLLKHSGHNIRHFEWLPSIHFCSSVGPINISPSTLPNLASLRFVVSFRKTHAHGPFPEVIRLLTQLASSPTTGSSSYSNSIHTITFECHCLPSYSPPNSPPTLQPPGTKFLLSTWKPLDKLLSKPAFGNLKRINVVLPTSTSTMRNIQGFVLAFQDALPLVQEARAGKVVVEVRARKVVDERFGVWEQLNEA